eukprot:CAMPEP_0172472032 /NCGR_PEP_ID=MMETSP1065-20121228/68123_1 /TAXON_ID=265537 /ORGANISM="Amphiprora paludosa, Strain CCMP125" /LENGTH=294 /DNA_ID=CAMNT_0013230147 /DNA_START=81 /DNA_END=966 /DNA_ORIENTATION=-
MLDTTPYTYDCATLSASACPCWDKPIECVSFSGPLFRDSSTHNKRRLRKERRLQRYQEHQRALQQSSYVPQRHAASAPPDVFLQQSRQHQYRTKQYRNLLDDQEAGESKTEYEELEDENHYGYDFAHVPRGSTPRSAPPNNKSWTLWSSSTEETDGCCAFDLFLLDDQEAGESKTEYDDYEENHYGYDFAHVPRGSTPRSSAPQNKSWTPSLWSSSTEETDGCCAFDLFFSLSPPKKKKPAAPPSIRRSCGSAPVVVRRIPKPHEDRQEARRRRAVQAKMAQLLEQEQRELYSK